MRLDNEFLRSRPVGYITTPQEDISQGNEEIQNKIDEIFRQDVQREMKNISELFSDENNMLMLKTRFSYYWVPQQNIMFMPQR